MESTATFDGLATNYDSCRPRYPENLLRTACGPHTNDVRLADVGAGTGISLEWLLPGLHNPTGYAIDVSQDMVAAGQQKFPEITWLLGRSEDVLPTLHDLHIVLAGQAYQWFDRPAFLTAAHNALVTGGRLVIIQNNRDYATSEFLDAYEQLLEQRSPGYHRTYRDIDVAAELATGFGSKPSEIIEGTATWVRPMTIDEFVGMSSSSSQVQRAVTAHGEAVLDEVRSLAESHAADGTVSVTYRTELFVAVK